MQSRLKRQEGDVYRQAAVRLRTMNAKCVVYRRRHHQSSSDYLKSQTIATRKCDSRFGILGVD
ncbi:MAG: hypothetical protein RMY63_21765 [Nostoc sp. ChiQUE01b]|nr:hypothetical protein [Nostoc sp. ChiQUE01b]